MKKRSLKAFLIIAPALVLIGLVSVKYELPLVAGYQLKHRIVGALEDAETVQVIEYSDPAVVFDSQFLSSSEIENLIASLPVSSDDATASECIFDPHHRLKITGEDGSRMGIKLCFKCDDLKVDGENARVFPSHWSNTLRTFIASLGMSADGPWDRAVTPAFDLLDVKFEHVGDERS